MQLEIKHLQLEMIGLDAFKGGYKMKEKVLNKLKLSERELNLFQKLKENYNITDKLFYKNNDLYSIKIVYKDHKLEYQLKENGKIILKTNNKKTIENRILKILC